MQTYRALRVLRADRGGSSWPVLIDTEAGVFYTKLRGAAQAPATLNTELQPRPWRLRPDLEELSRTTKDAFLSLTDHNPIRRAKHTGLLRNVEIARWNRPAS